MKRNLILAVLFTLPRPCFAEQTLVRYLEFPPGSAAQAVSTDTSGNIFVAANVSEPSGRKPIEVIKTDPTGLTLATFTFGGNAINQISGLAVDGSGNVVIVGSTNSTDFQLTAPLISHTTAGQFSGFLVKLDSALKAITFSTLLGGTQGGGTVANAVALDSSGNIYVTGGTGDVDFPITSSAFQKSPPPNSPGNPMYGFVSELSSDGQHLIFSTFFGNSGISCNGGGGSCAFAEAVTQATRIALDSEGNITIAGNTTANNLPVTADAYSVQCQCSFRAPAGFVSRLSGNGSSLLWATYAPPFPYSPQSDFPLSGEVLGLALDSSGDAVISGFTQGGLTTSAGALQPTFPGQLNTGQLAGFVAKIDTTGHQLLFATYFGGGSGEITAVTVDSQGLIWLTGSSNPSELPAPAGTRLLGNNFLSALNPNGSSVVELITAPQGAAGQALALSPDNEVLALGIASSLLVTTSQDGPSLLGVANSAATQVSNVIAPYELISLFGLGIGPSTSAAGQLVEGVFTDSLSGVQVLFDGSSAPLLYAGPTQINAVVPSAIAGQDKATLQIVTPSGTIQGPTFLLRPSQPAVFGTSGSGTSLPAAIALNQDGSVNSAGNPALAGSAVSVWATGAGAGTVPWPDGGLLSGVVGGLLLPVSVLYIGPTVGESLQVLYAGNAPGLVAGAVQVNFQLPANISGTVDLALQVGDAVSQSFSLFIK